MARTDRKLWLARLLVGGVLAMNLQAALAFLFTPKGYAPGFELSGAAGAVLVRSFGLLFVMWNVPYAVAAWHPLKHRTSLWEAVVMQTLGVGGETLLWLALGPGHPALAATVTRFIVFDAAGLAALLAAAGVSRRAA
jgi:hypothetical protein